MNMEPTASEEIINSLDWLQPATPPPFLYTRVMQKIDALKETYTPMRIVWLAAASFLLLLALNIQAMRRLSRPAPDTAKAIAEGYHLLNSSMIDYNE